MLVSDAITSAYREANIVRVGNTPTAAETAEGLALINSFWKSLLGYEFGEYLRDWPVPPPAGRREIPTDLTTPANETWWLVPQSNTRLLVNVTTATTITLPAYPADGARFAVVDVGSASVNLTLNGNGRLIDGQTSAVDTVAMFSGKTWFYRADLASWEEVVTLTAASQTPLPSDFDDLFITYLAIRFAPRHDKELPPETMEVYNSLLKRAKARYRQSQDVAVADPRYTETMQSYGQLGVSWQY